jgi:hypothetical protein
MVAHEAHRGNDQRVPVVRNSALQPAADATETIALVQGFVYRILPTLPSHLAEILWRVDLAGQPLGDAAEAAGITTAEACRRLKGARARLRGRVRAGVRLFAAHKVRSAREGGDRFKPARSATLARATRLLRRLFGMPYAGKKGRLRG